MKKILISSIIIQLVFVLCFGIYISFLENKYLIISCAVSIGWALAFVFHLVYQLYEIRKAKKEYSQYVKIMENKNIKFPKISCMICGKKWPFEEILVQNYIVSPYLTINIKYCPYSFACKLNAELGECDLVRNYSNLENK